MAAGRKGAAILGLGAACAAGLGYLATLLWRRRGGLGTGSGGARPAITGTGGHGAVGDSGAARSAGPDSMRDPPSEWEQVDQSSDESFPASDPPSINPHVD